MVPARASYWERGQTRDDSNVRFGSKRHVQGTDAMSAKCHSRTLRHFSRSLRRQWRAVLHVSP